MPTQFTLNKSERLKSRTAIDLLFKKGEMIAAGPVRIKYAITPQEIPEGVKAGFSVSKRNFKRATDRNRVKRLLREAFRLQKTTLCQQVASQDITLHIFVLFTGKVKPEFTEVYSKMTTILEKLTQKLHEKAV